MKSLDSQLLKVFLNKSATELSGSWLLVGGTLLPALGVDVRPTIDIDLIPISQRNNQGELELMRIADSLGLPVESINQSAKYFVEQIGYQQKDLILLIKGRKSKIYRPSFELYCRLKVARLTETDRTDIAQYHAYCLSNGEISNLQNLKKFLEKLKKAEKNPNKKERLQNLIEMLKA